MSKNDFSKQKWMRVVLLLGQFIVLVVCVTFLILTYLINILPDAAVKKNFQATNCFLTSKKLSSHGLILRRYRADFLISYNVNGVQYNRWVSGNGLDNSYTQKESEQEDILAQFEVGRNYRCWYDPENPHLAILVPRHNWLAIFPLIAPAVIGVITLYFFLRNLLKLISKRQAKRARLKNSKTIKKNKK